MPQDLNKSLVTDNELSGCNTVNYVFAVVDWKTSHRNFVDWMGKLK